MATPGLSSEPNEGLEIFGAPLTSPNNYQELPRMSAETQGLLASSDIDGTKNRQISLRQESIKPPMDLAYRLDGIDGDYWIDGFGQIVTSGISANSVPNTGHSALTETRNVFSSQVSRHDTMHAAEKNAMQPRTIVVNKKPFDTPSERAFEPANYDRLILEAGDLFRQSLIQPTPISASTHGEQPALASVAKDEEGFVAEGGFEAPILIDDDDEEAKPAALSHSLWRLLKQNQTLKDDGAALDPFAESGDLQPFGIPTRREHQTEIEIKKEDSGDDLFFPDEKDNQQANHPLHSGSEEIKATERPPKKRRKGDRADRVPPKSLTEGLEAGWEFSKTRREKEASKGTKKSKASESKESTGRGKKSEKNKSKGGTSLGGPTLLNIGSLFGNDIVGAARANQSKGELPTFKSKNKAEALRELIASMPTDQQKLATVDKRALDRAIKAFNGHGSMRSDGDSNWKLKGMRSSLKPFQVLGVAFMRKRENSSSRPYGGLDADVMGLGKTIKMIANILDGNAASGGASDTTLIVCPSALCIQWFKEIEKHTERKALGEVTVYRHSKSYFSDPVAALSRFNIVITPYSEVTKSYPQLEQPKHLVTEQKQREWWERQYSEKRGLLHQIYFRRIVLDEAQVIKNHNSKVSLACRSLNGKYRWALSGTPIQNSVDEFFPYFSFLKVDHTGSYATFKANYCKKGSTIGVQRLRAILEKVMIRRTHEDEMFGRPLAKLPGITTETVSLEFSPIERAIYKIVRSRFIAQIRMYANAGPLNQSYRTILVFYLRLRQLVSHILLIHKTLKELLEAEDLEKLWRLCDSGMQSQAQDDNILSQLRSMLSNAFSDQEKSPPAGDLEAKSSRHPQPTLESSSGVPDSLSSQFTGALQNLYLSGMWAEINARSVCHKCGGLPQHPHVTSCMHVYCKECLSSMSYEATKRSKDFATCLECDAHFTGSEPCQGFEQAALSSNSRLSNGRQKRQLHSTDEDVCWLDLGSSSVESTKTLAIRNQCRQWQQEDPEAKIVIFTQFRGMITILQRVCREEDWGCLSFHGALTTDQKDGTIQEFQDNPQIKILVTSLKAGGVGLNLMMASKVIIVDLWWNECVENQALCRCYRIGQNRRVDIKRFVVKDTIDVDILAMQERKSAQINGALEGGNSPQSLSIRDLVHLFGPLQLDEDGNLIGDPDEDPFIFVEDGSEDGEPTGASSRPVDWKSTKT